MSLTHTLTRAYRDASGTSIVATESVTSNMERNYDDSIADSTTNFEVDIALIRSLLQSLSIYSDHAVSIKTNGTGSAGAITSSAINAPGSGYAIGDTGTIAGGTAGTYIVTGVNGSGAVTAFTVTVVGSAYAVGSHATATGGAQAGSGTGFTITVSTIVETFSLNAGQMYPMWTLANDTLTRLPFTCDVNKLYITNSSGSAAKFQVRSLSDVTP